MILDTILLRDEVGFDLTQMKFALASPRIPARVLTKSECEDRFNQFIFYGLFDEGFSSALVRCGLLVSRGPIFYAFFDGG